MPDEGAYALCCENMAGLSIGTLRIRETLAVGAVLGMRACIHEAAQGRLTVGTVPAVAMVGPELTANLLGEDRTDLSAVNRFRALTAQRAREE
ncbi:hypothetical protein MFU01_05490 [Myxococcus fulvus]|uniref:Uncharacterized protein n=1 Tax=Myxococcus fulvus TaxID=33 RepID=A0A511SVM2_MYXFU|nr:hypothetical protein MFU01_05490 [Myxococcus fulvus]